MDRLRFAVAYFLAVVVSDGEHDPRNHVDHRCHDDVVEASPAQAGVTKSLSRSSIRRSRSELRFSRGLVRGQVVAEELPQTHRDCVLS
jgi:hypothetical protein